MNNSLQAGFTSPVLQAQQSFRVLLKAMSEPATIQTLGISQGLEKISPATYDLLLSLCDNDTVLWISPALDSLVVRQNLAFHCACPISESPQEADFALLTVDDLEVLKQLNSGTDRDPELSCTAILQLDELYAVETKSFATQWRGPGIEKPVQVSLDVPTNLWVIREQINQFPCGIDMVFCEQQQLLALPRSTQVIFQKD
ncbi:MAG TPA: phosphonate C-P lyase system protein PhnH [Oligella sp.]|nr:phosphonate C-P lyase system protein PhnH [Oligella sp.]